MPKPDKQTVDLLNFNTGRTNGRIDKRRYDSMKRALLRVIPRAAAGVAYTELKGLVAPLLPPWWQAEGWSVSWHISVVKLDLEARGLIERVPASRPMHLRRVTGAR